MSSINEPSLPEKLQPNEYFTRFIRNRDHFARTTGRVKPSALLPMFNEESNRLETSVFRTLGMSAVDLWQLGYMHVEGATPKPTIKARASGPFALVNPPLFMDVNGPPFPRHVDIIGWSSQKHVQLQHATNITDKLVLELDPRQ